MQRILSKCVVKHVESLKGSGKHEHYYDQRSRKFFDFNKWNKVLIGHLLLTQNLRKQASDDDIAGTRGGRKNWGCHQHPQFRLPCNRIGGKGGSVSPKMFWM